MQMKFWFKFSWYFIFLSFNRFRVCSVLVAVFFFFPLAWCKWPPLPSCLFLAGQKVVVLLPFGWILNEISYRLWLDWNIPSCGWYRTKFKRYMLIWSWSSSTWSETCVYLHQASWVMHSVLRCATSGFWRQARRCTGRTIKAWDVI